jgi:signal transduction histidine kinase
MTDGKGKGLSHDSTDGLKEVLQAVEDTFRNGSVPEGPVIPADEEIRKKVQQILSDIAATQKFALAMAQGDLSQDLAVKGHMAGSLKSLQSSLRHLTWQAGQIAGGDLSQRVHFMGDFSDSFNTMVEHLAEDENDRNTREDELRRVNTALVNEVAERRKTEEALRLANKKITMLSSITRHDILNQVMILQAYLEYSRENTRDPMLLDYIKKEDHVAEAIRSQIEFTKYYEDIGVNAPEWQDIPHLVQRVRSRLHLPDTIDVSIVLPPVQVFADRLIEKVFFNLMENTLRHGGQVTRIRFAFDETNRGAEIVYEDNGVGISTEDKRRLFQKGFGKNTGLGLFLSQEILAITGLTIRETGEPGNGVRFVIAVPEGAYRLSGNN